MATVLFRDFEERDIDFIYQCKNDEKLNSMIVGEWHPFSYEEAEKWVRGCMGDHDTYKFWAICTSDEEQRIVGWVSLSEIDKVNKSAFFHSIVIADKNYHDGVVWLESNLFIMAYTFEQLKFNRLYGSFLSGHTVSETNVLMWTREGVFRQVVFKNGRYYDLVYNAILKDEYFRNKENGEYKLSAILRRFKKIRKRAEKPTI